MYIKVLKNNGTALLVTILVLTSVMTIVFATAALVLNGLYMNRTQNDSAKALYASEVGAERILQSIRMQCYNVSSCDVEVNKYIDFDNGACAPDRIDYYLPNSAYYYVIYSAPNTFRSFGFSSTGVKRVMEISSGVSYGSCIEDCTGKECGDDGCGGSCGDCDPSETCLNNFCQPL